MSISKWMEDILIPSSFTVICCDRRIMSVPFHLDRSSAIRYGEEEEEGVRMKLNRMTALQMRLYGGCCCGNEMIP